MSSGYNFANKALSYSLGLRPDSIAAEEWHHYFDVIICSAHKPDFYFSKRPFRKWNIPTSTSGFTPVGKVEKGSVYINGSLRALVNTTGWKGKVLYIGDNLKADLVEACRWHGWHTACIINELEQEIDVQNTSDFQYLHLLRSSMRSLMIDLQQKTEEEKEVPQRDSTYILLDCIEKELKVINNSLSISFNPQFGSIFRTDGHPSLFSFAVRRYADLYTSDVCNFANYDPSHRFYPSRSIRMVRYKYDDCWSTHVFAYSSGDLAWFIDWFSATVCYRTISYRIFI